MSKTHFGYETVDEDEKEVRVKGVFDSVAKKYDLMNDLMSVGMHRLWKAKAIAVAKAQEGQSVLDIAAGTGDLSQAFAKKVGASGQVIMSDINEAMLVVGRARSIDGGYVIPAVVCDAEKLPFQDEAFDIVSVSFGLRNMTHKDVALKEMCRVLKPGGKLLVLEFSKVAKPLQKPYDWYSYNILPRIGSLVVGDADSYRYLAESIRMHPDQETLKGMMKEAGFGHVDIHNMAFGAVALHAGIKC